MTTYSPDSAFVPPLGDLPPVAPVTMPEYVAPDLHVSPSGSSQPEESPPAPTRPAPTSRLGRLWRGRPDDAAWIRPALLALLVGTGVLYIWGLGASGWANSFYSAAVQAGTKS